MTWHINAIDSVVSLLPHHPLLLPLHADRTIHNSFHLIAHISYPHTYTHVPTYTLEYVHCTVRYTMHAIISFLPCFPTPIAYILSILPSARLYTYVTYISIYHTYSTFAYMSTWAYCVTTCLHTSYIMFSFPDYRLP